MFATFQNISKRYPPPFNILERVALTRADGWIAFGRSVEAVLNDRPMYATRPHAMIPFGVDTTRFMVDRGARAALRTGLGWEGETPVVGYVGRFIDAKGIPLLLGVLRELARQGVAWRALFVGGGPLDATLRTFAAEYQGRVHVATDVGHDEGCRGISTPWTCSARRVKPRQRGANSSDG